MEENVCKEEAYRPLFYQLMDGLRNYLFFHCRDAGLAEDLAQEAFIRLWEHCKKVAPAKAKAFLYRVGYNLFLDQMKHRKVVQHFQSRQQARHEQENPEFAYLGKEFEARIWAAIDSMPEKSREVFLMNRIDGLPYREIAERLDIGLKAVEKRMSIALDVMRKAVKG